MLDVGAGNEESGILKALPQLDFACKSPKDGPAKDGERLGRSIEPSSRPRHLRP